MYPNQTTMTHAQLLAVGLCLQLWGQVWLDSCTIDFNMTLYANKG